MIWSCRALVDINIKDTKKVAKLCKILIHVTKYTASDPSNSSHMSSDSLTTRYQSCSLALKLSTDPCMPENVFAAHHVVGISMIYKHLQTRLNVNVPDWKLILFTLHRSGSTLAQVKGLLPDDTTRFGEPILTIGIPFHSPGSKCTRRVY